MVAPASAVFTDISDSRVSQTAAVLDALGIMQGVGGGSFAPGKALTRAQFCKLAVTAMGVTDVSPSCRAAMALAAVTPPAVPPWVISRFPLISFSSSMRLLRDA